jgi:hypothetical protein
VAANPADCLFEKKKQNKTNPVDWLIAKFSILLPK